jgi:hypothetical protein
MDGGKAQKPSAILILSVDSCFTGLLRDELKNNELHHPNEALVIFYPSCLFCLKTFLKTVDVPLYSD